MTAAEARPKLYRYCAYQERCHQDVETKLRELRVPAMFHDELIHHLVSEGFLNEERFARAFAGGKFRLKRWGRLRIRQELEQRNLSSYCIKSGLSEINEADYLQTLRLLISQKSESLETDNIYILRDRVSRFVIQKGFEPELVWQELRLALPDRP